jgi:hypothetical protein
LESVLGATGHTLPAKGDRQFETGGSSAAPKCSNQTELRMTLADLFYGSNLPERPSPTSMRLVCIQKAIGSRTLVQAGRILAV